MNHLAGSTANNAALNGIFNTEVGERNDLNKRVFLLKKYLVVYYSEIADIPILHGPNRKGDIPRYLVAIAKAKAMQGYDPVFNQEMRLKLVVDWYSEAFK